MSAMHKVEYSATMPIKNPSDGLYVVQGKVT
jgi:hypothetical protein